MDIRKTSIAIIKAGQAPNGAYVASPAFSQYGYCWLRDSTWIAYAMDCAGEHASARAFYQWVGRTLPRFNAQVDRLLGKLAQGITPDERDYLPTRFTLDGGLAGDAWWDFQLDGYGTWLWGLIAHLEMTRDHDLWQAIIPAVDLTVRYLDAVWQFPCYDCWEEHRDKIHMSTLAALYGGLSAIQCYAPEHVPDGLPEAIRAFALAHGISDDGHLMKFIAPPDDTAIHTPEVQFKFHTEAPDADVVDASLLWAGMPYGLVHVDDPVFAATLARIERDIKRPGGGVYRYAADTYYGGGEWILLTAWLGWVYARLGRTEDAQAIQNWIAAQATGEGHLAEQVSDHLLAPEYYAEWEDRWGPIARPLLWSHAMTLILESHLEARTMNDILHRPHGLEHPYEQEPDERFPRDPFAGEPFTIGIGTKPPGAVDKVTVHTSIDGAPGPSIPAEIQPDWRPKLEDGVGAEFLERMVHVEQDIWHAALIAPQAGQTLEYWIETAEARSETYTLTPSEWREAPYAIQTTDANRWQLSPGAGAAPHFPAWLPGLQQVEWLTDGSSAKRVRLTFSTTADEAFFGLGERYNALNQRGNIMDIRCYEQYKTQQKRTYMPVPFLLSSEGYGLHVQSSRWMQFDLAATQDDQWVLEADLGPDETLDMQWFTGESALDIISQFTMATGKPVMPPAWSFGLWMSGNEWNSQARVEAEVTQSFEHGIIPSALVIEAWSDETTFYIWNDAEYTPRTGDAMPHLADFTFPAEGRWPDPKGMIDKLHEQNIRLLLWQVPAFKRLDTDQHPNGHPQHEADWDYFEAQGFGVKNPDGSPYTIRPFWFRDGYLWDVTNPAARNWWLGKRAYLLEEMGIDGFKTDGGEHLWGASTRFHDGRQGDELWNEYPKRYTDAYYQFATSKRSDAMTFSRAGFTGSQSSPAHWAGDENSTWEAYRASILAGLSAGISGIPFWGWDIGGFSGEIPSAELYLRSAAMATFCPIMQYHAEYNAHRKPWIDRTPWNIQERTGDARVIPTFRHFVNVRHNLMPYIWQEALHASESGQPMMRALMLTDANATPYQYMFGRDLLVCPVTDPDATTWDVYLPQGLWHDLWSDTTYEGGRTITMNVPLDHIPVFVRDGAVIPVRFGEARTWGEPVSLSTEASEWVRYTAS